jgi:hypothetical protein
MASAGLRQLRKAQFTGLQHLRIDGCRVSTTSVLAILKSPGKLVLWDEQQRGHMPRCINVLNVLLVTEAPQGKRRLRLSHAPEANWLNHLLMCGLVSGIFISHCLLLLTTIIVLLLLPIAIAFLSLGFLLLYVVRAVSPDQRAGIAIRCASMFMRVETLLSAVLVGIHCTSNIPPPPPPLYR